MCLITFILFLLVQILTTTVTELLVNYDGCVSVSSEVIKGNPKLYTTLLLNVFFESQKWMLENRLDLILQCRKDEDWDNLQIPTREWLKIIDDALSVIVHTQRIPHSGDDDEEYDLFINTFISDVFGCLSCTFQIQARYERYSPLRHTQRDLFINWHSHYVRTQVLNDYEFVCWLSTNSKYLFEFTFIQEFIHPEDASDYDSDISTV